MPFDPSQLTPEDRQELLKQILRLQARDNTFAYGELAFGYKPAEHHVEMVNAIDEAIRTRQHTVILEPRGGAKSTWGNTIKGSHVIGNNHDIRIGLMSKSAQHAQAFSRGIRGTIERNPEFKEVFGHLVSDIKWTDAEWIVNDSKWIGSHYATLFAQGVGGQIVSKRFDLILCDDILDKENTANADQMAAVAEWFWGTLYPCLAENGVIVMLGTRWADGDLYGELIKPREKGGKGWRHIIRKALVPDESSPTGVSSWWPEVFPMERLEAMKEDMGLALFYCAMLNDVTGLMQGNVFSSRYFQYFDTLPTDRTYTVRMGVDLASSTKESADYTARVITAEDEDGNLFVLSYHADRIATGHADFIHNGWSAYPNVDAVIVENQQFQSTVITEVMRMYPRIPVQGRRADTDKTTRARGVAARYEAGKVFHHHSLKESEFEIQLTSFPKGHDDLVDALGYSFDLTGTQFSWSFVSSG